MTEVRLERRGSMSKFTEAGNFQVIMISLNLYAGQERVRTRHGTTDWFQIGKGPGEGSMCA